jgi:hypothetical protein
VDGQEPVATGGGGGGGHGGRRRLGGIDEPDRVRGGRQLPPVVLGDLRVDPDADQPVRQGGPDGLVAADDLDPQGRGEGRRQRAEVLPVRPDREERDGAAVAAERRRAGRPGRRAGPRTRGPRRGGRAPPGPGRARGPPSSSGPGGSRLGRVGVLRERPRPPRCTTSTPGTGRSGSPTVSSCDGARSVRVSWTRSEPAGPASSSGSVLGDGDRDGERARPPAGARDHDECPRSGGWSPTTSVHRRATGSSPTSSTIGSSGSASCRHSRAVGDGEVSVASGAGRSCRLVVGPGVSGRLRGLRGLGVRARPCRA